MSANGQRSDIPGREDIAEAISACTIAAMYVIDEPGRWDAFITWAQELDRDSPAPAPTAHDMLHMAMLAHMFATRVVAR